MNHSRNTNFADFDMARHNVFRGSSLNTRVRFTGGGSSRARCPIIVQAISKSQNDPDTLVNLICCCRHLDKPASFVDRYINQLKTAHPQHPYVQSLSNAESAFDRVAATFAVA